MDSNTVKVVAAVAGITLLEFTWISLGHNGTSLSLTIAAIAGLAGYEIARKRN